jgi:endonuclease G
VVPLPTVTRGRKDVLTFVQDGKRESELRYEHFSVVMSASRRLCVFSAANVDGAQSKKTKRAPWRTDPRIPKEAQILNECYGNPPKFSRGHMTRREDPAWGKPDVVDRGNRDSMHVTNTVPQMQAFNSPIWLELEDYALQNAREAKMQISVFTGPYFDFDGAADPVIDGVEIPRAFWKIIAFVHDETGELCATGYEMSQEKNLPTGEEFVFGDVTSSYLNVSTQVPIHRIEARTGLRFGDLAARDPLANAEEAAGEAEPRPLESLSQIRFI